MDEKIKDRELKLEKYEVDTYKVVVNENAHWIIYVVVFMMLIFVSQLDYLYKYSFNEVDQAEGSANFDTLASATELINIGNGNSNMSTLSKNQKTFIAEIEIMNKQQYLHIQSSYGNFKVPIYTLRDYDMDKGLIPKDYAFYPEIKVNVVGSLSTHGVLIETIQNNGYQTYSNKIYIRGSKVVDVGFQKRLSVNDTIKYYDNAILIVDTLHVNTKDFIRVYDDETGDVLFSINADEFGLERDYIDNLLFSGVSDHFLAYSTKHKGNVTDSYFCYMPDGTVENVSVWDKLEADEEEIARLKEYEINTSSDCITFVEYNKQNELVYKVKYLYGSTSDSYINIRLR